MAQYKVEYACGHQAEVSLFSKEAERMKRLEQMSKRNCPACDIAADRKSPNASLPVLCGSDAQVAWAVDIRAKAYSVALTYMDRLNALPSDLSGIALERANAMRQYIDDLFAVTTASEWISFDKAGGLVAGMNNMMKERKLAK